MLSQHLRQRQHEVGGGRSRGQSAVEPDADDDRGGEVRRLAEHRGFCLYPADAPPEHAEPIDHRGVRVGAHERVGDGELASVDLAQLDDPGDVLEVDLVADAHARWNQ